MRRRLSLAALGALLAAALSSCGVKAPPQPPLREPPDAGAPDGGADAGTPRPDGRAP